MLDTPCSLSWIGSVATTRSRWHLGMLRTTFKTPIRNFYYIVMHIRLKNAGTTYQRTMTAIFHDMMHCEMEHYVDDIVVSQGSMRIMLKY